MRQGQNQRKIGPSGADVWRNIRRVMPVILCCANGTPFLFCNIEREASRGIRAWSESRADMFARAWGRGYWA
jgi:hypothetical protein